MIGIIAFLFLKPPLNKMHKLVLHFFTEEDNYCCHCHIHFLVLITNELNLAHDQRSFSYPVNANSGYHTFCIDWRRKGRMDLDIIKFRICLTRKTLVPSYTLWCNTVGESPDGEKKNSDDKIPWTLMGIPLPNPETQLMYTAITLLDLFTPRSPTGRFQIHKRRQIARAAWTDLWLTVVTTAKID